MSAYYGCVILYKREGAIARAAWRNVEYVKWILTVGFVPHVRVFGPRVRSINLSSRTAKMSAVNGRYCCSIFSKPVKLIAKRVNKEYSLVHNTNILPMVWKFDNFNWTSLIGTVLPSSKILMWIKQKVLLIYYFIYLLESSVPNDSHAYIMFWVRPVFLKN